MCPVSEEAKSADKDDEDDDEEELEEEEEELDEKCSGQLFMSLLFFAMMVTVIAPEPRAGASCATGRAGRRQRR